MLISVKHNFVLILMPKCASTSLEKALRKHCDFVIAGSPRLKHLSAKHYDRYVGKLLARRLGEAEVFEKFCLFREPLDWLFSWYRYRMRAELAESDRRARNVTFAQFLEEHFMATPAKFARARPQSTYIEDNDGKHDKVTLYRYEDVEALIAEFRLRLNKKIKWKYLNVSPQATFDLSEEEISEARKKLGREYSIYDGIQKRQPPESVSNKG